MPKTRVQFQYTRTRTGAESGVLAVDVDDPKDADQIKQALRERDFSFFRPLTQEWDEDDFTFKLGDVEFED